MFVAEAGGTGTTRNARFGNGNVQLIVNANGSTAYFQNTNPTQGSTSTNTLFDGTWNGSAQTATHVAIKPTISQSSTSGYTALLINPTESSTGSGTKRLISGQVGGVDKFIVDNAGNTTTANLVVTSTKTLTLGNAATTGLAAGVLAALTNATIVISDSTGQAYRIPCII